MGFYRVMAVLLLSASVVGCTTPVQAQKKNAVVINNASPDDNFVALRAASFRGDADTSEALAMVLRDYPVPSYVDYYRLRPKLKNLQASTSEVLDYLNRYQGSAIADRLRNDWLLELGRAGDWTTFDQQYPLFVLDDDTQLKCYALTSAASKGQNVADKARTLLVSPKNYGDACVNLIAYLAQNGQFTQNDVWQQIAYASDAGNGALANKLVVYTDAQPVMLRRAWDKPVQVIASGPGRDAASHQLYILALARSARGNLVQVVNSLNNAQGMLSPAEQAQAWGVIAQAAAYALDPSAPAYFARTYGAALSPDGCAWRVRSSLRAGDWPAVKNAIESMPPALRDDDTWVYWLGRSLDAERHPLQARKLYVQIKDHYNFYGQLATEALGEQIKAPPRPPALTQQEMAEAVANPGFQRSLRFFNMGLRFEAIREWNWELRNMNDRQLLAAGEYARQQDVLDRMVNTSDRTRQQIDFSQRYPTPHLDQMRVRTDELGLDIALVYGLMRQESRFMRVARSSVGASGLMQIMPATAKYVARKIGMSSFDPSQINDTEVNITLGTSYISMVLGSLDNSETLATAGYNAGPGRPRAWRATLTSPVEGAIFAETIPFNETRDYVKNVLSNATYYAADFTRQPQSLLGRLGSVQPEGYVPPDLP